VGSVYLGNFRPSMAKSSTLAAIRIMTLVASKTDPPYEVWSGPDPLGALVASNRMARTDAQRMAGFDVKRPLEIAAVEVAFGGKPSHA
jgi:hypothetical protein